MQIKKGEKKYVRYNTRINNRRITYTYKYIINIRSVNIFRICNIDYSNVI